MADNLQATPRNEFLGLLSDAMYGGLDWMKDPRRSQQMQGLAGLLESTGIPQTTQRMAYGEPLTNIGRANVPLLKPETAEAMMNVAPIVGPAGRLAEQAAMKVGRAGERLAERVVPQVMESGGFGAGLLGDLARGTRSPLDVYHGTPHTLPPTERNPLGEFDASKIGTGEGGQAYGYGIYTAEAPDVAKGYARNLANADKMNQGRLTAHANAQRLAELTGSPEYAADDIRFVLESNPDHEQKKLLNETLKFLESGDYKKPLENKGNLYKVDLPDEKIATMLDWDKPVSQQKNVMGALRKEAEQRVKNRLQVDIENDIRSKLPSQNIGNDYMALFGDQNIAKNQDIKQQALDRLNKLDLKPLIEQELNSFKTPDMTWDMSGRDLYQLLSQRSGSPQQASGLLQSQGIAGIRYLDSQSRPTNITNIRLADLYQKYKGNAEAAVDEFMRSVYNTPKKKAEMRKQFLKELEAQKTSNFVVFPGEEKNMTILERNGMRGLLD